MDSATKMAVFAEYGYRQERRALVREIILEGLTETRLSQHFEKTARKLIPSSDRSAFVEDIKEDLEQIDQSRLAWLGVTPEQLLTWQKVSQKNHDS